MIFFCGGKERGGVSGRFFVIRMFFLGFAFCVRWWSVEEHGGGDIGGRGRGRFEWTEGVNNGERERIDKKRKWGVGIWCREIRV